MAPWIGEVPRRLPSQGERDAVKVGDGTGDVSHGRWLTSSETKCIRIWSEIQEDAGWEVGGAHSTGDDKDKFDLAQAEFAAAQEELEKLDQ
jgi:hypothetical protein